MLSDKELKIRQKKFVALYDKAPIKHTYECNLTYDKNNSAVFTQPYKPEFNHARGGIHGGVISTLLDNAGWFTAAPYYDTWIATAEFHVRLLEHVQAEDLVAIGKLIKLGKRLAVCEMKVTTKAGRLIALGSGSFVPTSAPLD